VGQKKVNSMRHLSFGVLRDAFFRIDKLDANDFLGTFFDAGRSYSGSGTGANRKTLK
jgi:hypothetical protein